MMGSHQLPAILPTLMENIPMTNRKHAKRASADYSDLLRITTLGINQAVRDYVNRGAYVCFERDGHLLITSERDGAGEKLLEMALPQWAVDAMISSPKVKRREKPLRRGTAA